GIAHLDALVDRHDAREDRDHGEERAREQSDRQRHDGHTRGDQRDLGVLADLLLLELDRVGLVGLHAHTFRIPHLAVQPRSRWSSPRPPPRGRLRTGGWRGRGRSPRPPRRRSCGPACRTPRPPPAPPRRAARTRARRPPRGRPRWPTRARSEEHTSELQSRFDLVCRLLLEKKKQKQATVDKYL